MPIRLQCLFASAIVCTLLNQALAQEPKPAKTAPPGVDKKYFDLTQSKDSKTKAWAERYINLVKTQEWGTASGKSAVAHYISHDPDLKHVKLGVVQGTGKDRTVKERDIDVTLLNKVCQARLKQIDTLQKKLDELAATAKPGDTAGAAGQGPGAMAEAPGPNRPLPPGPGEPPPPPPHAAAPPPDPSESEPDPLGFAELPPVAAPLPTAGRESAPPAGPQPPATSAK